MTCRYCREYGKHSHMLKYGVRHYAHLECLVRALTPDALKHLFTQVGTFPLGQIPFIEAEKLGIRELIQSELAERKAREHSQSR